MQGQPAPGGGGGGGHRLGGLVRKLDGLFHLCHNALLHLLDPGLREEALLQRPLAEHGNGVPSLHTRSTCLTTVGMMHAYDIGCKTTRNLDSGFRDEVHVNISHCGHTPELEHEVLSGAVAARFYVALPCPL